MSQRGFDGLRQKARWFAADSLLKRARVLLGGRPDEPTPSLEARTSAVAQAENGFQGDLRPARAWLHFTQSSLDDPALSDHALGLLGQSLYVEKALLMRRQGAGSWAVVRTMGVSRSAQRHLMLAGRLPSMDVDLLERETVLGGRDDWHLFPFLASCLSEDLDDEAVCYRVPLQADHRLVGAIMIVRHTAHPQDHGALKDTLDFYGQVVGLGLHAAWESSPNPAR